MRFIISTVLGLVFIVVTTATTFFHYVEGWAWIDAYYFTVVTLSTVGYGDITPKTDVGKIGATILIFVGLGVFALAVQQIGLYVSRQNSEDN